MHVRTPGIDRVLRLWLLGIIILYIAIGIFYVIPSLFMSLHEKQFRHWAEGMPGKLGTFFMPLAAAALLFSIIIHLAHKECGEREHPAPHRHSRLRSRREQDPVKP